MTRSTQPSAVVTPRRSDRLPPPPALSMQNIARGARYMSLPVGDATLFSSRGPQADDVVQGSMGDCWLMAALASLAHAQPQHVRDMIRPTHLPTVYEVRLFVPTDQGLRARWIRVDTRIAVESDGEIAYAGLTMERSGKRAVLWPALIEKAFARVLREDYREGYEALDGNHAERAFAVLTGSRTMMCYVDSLDRDTLEATMKAAPEHCMLIGSNMRGTEPWLQSGHYYTVLGMGPRKRVQLRDPHGITVAVPLAKVPELCHHLAVADL